MGKFYLNESKNGQFYFVLTADNGEVILSSEMYTTDQGCFNGIQSVKEHFDKDDNFELKESKDGKVYFVLTADNGEIIGKSEMYENTNGAENGIEAVKNNALYADIFSEDSEE